MEDNHSYDRRKFLDEIWESLHPGSIEYLNQSFQEIAPKLLEFLMLSVFSDETIDIGLVEGAAGYAIVPYDQFNYDKQLLLKLLRNSDFELELCLRDDEDEDVSYKYKLTRIDMETIPEGLRNVMQIVLESQEPSSVSVNNLKY